jgi:hypothetical protein
MVGCCRLGPETLSKQTDRTPSDPLGRDGYVCLCSSATVGCSRSTLLSSIALIGRTPMFALGKRRLHVTDLVDRDRASDMTVVRAAEESTVTPGSRAASGQFTVPIDGDKAGVQGAALGDVCAGGTSEQYVVEPGSTHKILPPARSPTEDSRRRSSPAKLPV